MSLAENVATLPQPRGGNYDLARFNALRHGVLSQHTVLPWEDGNEYRVLVEALTAEHEPKGPTEEHLVEELAGVIWRKRRLRLGEAAAHHRALKRASDPYQHTAEAALINVTKEVEANCIGDAIRATDEQTAEDTADLAEAQTVTEEALGILASPSSSAYSRALAALREDTQSWWHQQLSWGPRDYDEDQTPYRADAESLRRFIEGEVLPWYKKRRLELDYRLLIREQAFGEAVDPDRLERLARYEVRQPPMIGISHQRGAIVKRDPESAQLHRVSRRHPTRPTTFGTPVFEAMLEKAMRLCEGACGHLYTYDGERFHQAAVDAEPLVADWWRQYGPVQPKNYSSPLGRLVAGERIIRIVDARDDPG